MTMNMCHNKILKYLTFMKFHSYSITHNSVTHKVTTGPEKVREGENAGKV